ncbi:MAG: EAL domain-containing protein [Pseudomonadota bacterium]
MNAPQSNAPRAWTSPVSQTLAGDAGGVLLVVGSSEETSKRIESFLRNSGHPLRCGWTDDASEMQDVLRRAPPDVLLCDDTHPICAAEDLISSANEIRPDLPVLVIGKSVSPDEVVGALTLGAKDLVCCEDLRHLRHLELVVLREFVGHYHLRTLRLLRERMQDFEQRHSMLLEGAADAIVRIHEGIISEVNPAFLRLLGCEDASAFIGSPVIDFVASEQRVRVKERLRSVLKGKHNSNPLEFDFTGKEDAHIPVSTQLILGTDNGEKVIEMLVRSVAPAPAPVVLAPEPVREPATAAMETTFGTHTIPTEGVVARASRSPLSGRVGFLKAIASPTKDVEGPHGALMILVDHFPALEERIGLTSTEEVVEQLTAALKEKLGPADVLFGFSPSEIGAVVKRPRIADIEAVGEELRRELSAMIFATRDHEAQLTFSIAVYPLAGTEKPDQVVTEVVREARRMSLKGGNLAAVIGAAAKSSQNDREEARKAAMVKKAIEENRLKLAYQSIASLEGEARQHFDVLVRMMDESGKELHAGEFLPAAEKYGLMKNIDRWVLARCLAIIAKRGGGKEAPSLFIKVSEDSLKDAEGYIRWVTELLKTYPLKNEEFVFEIQELILQNHVRKAKGITQALSDLGAGIAIDHFGTSANSIQLIEHLPKISYLKFHPTYTQKFNDKDLQRRMGQLMEIAKQKKIKTIVSHVEDANVMARLWQMGVNYIQGYHVQEPEVVLLASEFITKARSIHAPR